MIQTERAYLRAKAIYLALILDSRGTGPALRAARRAFEDARAARGR